MYSLGSLVSFRFFSASSRAQGGVKKRLNQYVKEGRLLPTPIQKQRKPPFVRTKDFIKKRVSKVEEREAAYMRRQKFAHVVKTSTGDTIDPKSIGPTTDDDLKYYPQANRKMLLTMLGTSEDQLKNSVFVQKSVQAFLARGQLQKAMIMARMAGRYGVVGMNFIVDHFIKNKRYNEALDLHSYRKKWNVPPNNEGITMLFDGFANVSGPRSTPGLKPHTVRRLKSFFENMKPTDILRPNVKHLNSCLEALINCEDQTIAFELYEKIRDEPEFRRLKPDIVTYSILLHGLAKSKNDIWAAVRAENLMTEVRKKFHESQLDYNIRQAYARVFMSRERFYLKQRGIKIAQTYFEIASDESKADYHLRLTPVERGEKLEFDDVTPVLRKLQPGASLMDLLLNACIRIGDESLGVKFFNEFAEKYSHNVDVALIHRYLKCLEQSDRENAGDNLVSFYNELINSPKYSHVKIKDETTSMVFRGIQTQIKRILQQGRIPNSREINHKFYDLTESFLKTAGRKCRFWGYHGYLGTMRLLRLNNAQKEVVRGRVEEARKVYEKTDKSNVRDLTIKEYKIYLSERVYADNTPLAEISKNNAH